MELSIVMRLRIAAVLGVGAVLLGWLGWPLVAPADPMGAVTLFYGDIGALDVLVCGLIAFAVGFAGYVAAFPHGKRLGGLAVPAGLGVWALRGGDMSSILIRNNTLEQRLDVYNSLQLEGLVWFGLIAVGFAGVIVASKIIKATPGAIPGEANDDSKQKYVKIAAAVVATIVIAQVILGVLARDVKNFDSQLGTVIGQPGVGQVGFAVFVAFLVAAFVAKQFLNVSYVWPVVAAPLLTLFIIKIYATPDVLGHMVDNWPASIYSRPGCAILPIQVMAFAAIGAVMGYWIAINYAYWRKHGE